jgi:hypothetical protein
MTWPRSLRVDSEDSPGGWWGTSFPVGGLFLSVVNVNPGTAASLGFGTWTLFTKGRLLLAPPGPPVDVFMWQRVS